MYILGEALRAVKNIDPFIINIWSNVVCAVSIHPSVESEVNFFLCKQRHFKSRNLPVCFDCFDCLLFDSVSLFDCLEHEKRFIYANVAWLNVKSCFEADVHKDIFHFHHSIAYKNFDVISLSPLFHSPFIIICEYIYSQTLSCAPRGSRQSGPSIVYSKNIHSSMKFPILHDMLKKTCLEL